MQKWLNVAKQFCNKQNVKISIRKGNCPSTDGNTIFLPELPVELKELHRKQLIWWLIHESNHINDTDFDFDFSISKYPHQTIHSMTNAFEDARIDAKRIIREPNLSMYHAGRIKLLLEENAERGNPFSLTYAVSVAPLAESHYLDSGCVYSEKLEKNILTYLKAEEPDLCEKVVAAKISLRDKVSSMCKNLGSTTQDAFEIAEEYLDLIQCFEKKPESQESEDAGDGEPDNDESDESDAGNGGSDDDSQGDESDESDAGNGGSSDDSEGDESDESDAGNGGSSDDSEGDESDESDAGNGGSGDDSEGEESNEGKPSTILEFDEDSDADHPMAANIDNLIEEIENDKDYENIPKFGFSPGWNDEFDIIEKQCPANQSRFNEIMSGLSKQARNLEEHLEDLLSDMVRSKEVFKDTGRFNQKSIRKYVGGRSDAFSNIEREENPARHLSILIDVSGSMGAKNPNGEAQIVDAIRAAGLLLPSLDIIDASYSVTTFGDGVHTVKGTSDLTETGIARLGALEDLVAGSTPMGEALQLALDSLPSTAESHDVLIITDGGPNDANLVNEHGDYAFDSGITTHILSVGVNPEWASSNLNTVFVNKMDELDEALIELVENIILAE